MNKGKNDKYIDPVKMGKFMTKCRKEKGLTQEDIASKFGITSQSVCKWESGKTAPDITLLIKLSEILDVEVHELLLGEKDNSSGKNDRDDKNNQTFVENVKVFGKKLRKNHFKIAIAIITLFIIVLFGVSSLYIINNYNKVKMYKISSADNLVLDGRIIFNPERKIISINSIIYSDIYTNTDMEIKAKEVNFKLVNGDRVLLDCECPDNSLGELKNISEFLEKVHIEVSSPLSGDEFTITEDDLENIEFVIVYMDSHDNNIELKFPLTFVKEFSNNKIFY